MARLATKTDVVRALFARSGNQCAFPDCTHELINHRNQLVAHVCHIEAASDGGERPNPALSDERRRHYDNLLLLCYAHHVETNDESIYTVDIMKSMKIEHEKRNQHSNFEVTKEIILEAQRQSKEYWIAVSNANTIDHSFEELKFEIISDHSFEDNFTSLRENLARMKKLLDICGVADERLPQDLKKLFSRLGVDYNLTNSIPYYENPFENRNWELHNLGTENWSTAVLINVLELEIKFYELKEIASNISSNQKERLNEARNELLHMAQFSQKVD